jgi:hypothetical protein
MTIRSGLIFFLSSCLVWSCSYRNEFGQDRVRFNIQRIKANSDENVYNIIDTAKIYSEISITDNSGKPVSIPDYKPTHLKFYKDGRVAEFKDIDMGTINSFNPKQARSSLYNLTKGQLIIQTYFRNPQCGQCFLKERFEKTSDGSFQLKNDSYIKTFKATEIPKSYLIFKPDW